MRRFALRETEVEHARSFEPIVAGPVVAVLVVLLAGALGALCAPFVYMMQKLQGKR